jgi:hypothetical protein
LTGLLQPFMELFGNRMTAHFWHFRKIKLNKNELLSNHILQVQGSLKTKRIFGRNKLLAILTSIWVDINPQQNCLIIQPIDYTGQWQLVFPSNWDQGIFEEEKCFHRGPAKIVVDGSGIVMARNSNGKFVELQIITKCKAYQNRHILFI